MIKDIEEFYYRTLLRLISDQRLVNVLNLKFNGLLKDIEINTFSISLLENLIKNNIYIGETYSPENFGGNYRHFIHLDSEDWFGMEGLYNGKLYYLNPKIYEEIYQVANYVINEHYLFKNVFKEDLANQISKLQALLKPNEKLDFLNKLLKKLWSPNDETESFLLFMNVEKNLSYFENWKDDIENSLTFDNDICIRFLTIKSVNQSNFYQNAFRLWVKFSRMKNLINFCIEKILEIENPKKKQPSLSELIFKSDGLLIFNFIDSKYIKPKNTAFYSYLYQFLQNKNKLHLTGSDSIDYKNYIIRNTALKKFSRIQKTDSKNQFRKEINFNLFESWIKEYYSNIIEDNLSKNE